MLLDELPSTMLLPSAPKSANCGLGELILVLLDPHLAVHVLQSSITALPHSAHWYFRAAGLPGLMRRGPSEEVLQVRAVLGDCSRSAGPPEKAEHPSSQAAVITSGHST